MAEGLIAGAIQGLGGAMQQNAQGQIEEKRKKALMALEQEMAFEQQDRQWGRDDQVWDRETTREDKLLDKQRGWEVEDRDLGYENEWGMTRYQQGQQNARHYSSLSAREREGSNDWQMVKTEDGGLVQYSPTRNSWREADLPEGAIMGGGGDMTDREQARVDMLSSQAESLREKMAEGIEPLTADEKARLGRIEAELDSMLGGSGGGPTPLERLMAGEEGAGERAQGGSQSEQPADSVPGIINRTRQEQRNTQEANEARRQADEARERADEVIERIEREEAGGASPGSTMANINQARGRGGVSDETIAEAQQVAEELLALDSNTNLSADQKRWLAERLMRLQDAGVPINLEQ